MVNGDGKARIVIQDAAAHQRLLEALDEVETERIVRERLAAMDRGEAGVPADKVLSAVRKRLQRKRK